MFSSSISFFVLCVVATMISHSSSSFFSGKTRWMALGSRRVDDGTSRDRDCECRCEETENASPETLRHLFVGDPEKCTKEECQLKFPEETCFSNGTLEATFVSCLCSCGGHPLVEKLFESEDSSECTEAACATRFSEVCPGIASETSDNENFATFLDCSCGCQTSTAFSEVEFAKRFFAGSTAACSPRACRTRLSEDACSSDDDVISKYTGPPPDPRMGYDCECGCDERVFEINVGDAAMCVEATCKQKEAFCANAKAVEAKYVDCMCDCCQGSQCPNLVHNLFHSGNMESCTPSACASAFDECPQPLGPSNEETYATYLDCNCQCVGSDEEYSRFFAGSSDTCSRDQCRTWLSLDTCFSGSEIIAYYTGSASGPNPPPDPRMGYDCECGCDERVFEINVGDAAMCVEATCKQKEAFCANAKAVEAKYVDCMCDCCQGSQCPNLVHNLFHSGNMESCTPSACASAFDECPQPLGPSNEETYATYLDCNCQCVGSDEEYSRFFAGSSDTCSRDQCRTWLSLDTCFSGSEIIAYYTGSASGPKTTIKLSREEVVVIAVVLALVAFSLSGYFGYRYYQRRYRGYKWMVMDDETPPEERSSRTLLEFKSLRSQHASKYSTNIEVSDLRVVVPNNDPGYEIQREEFISRKIGLV